METLTFEQIITDTDPDMNELPQLKSTGLSFIEKNNFKEAVTIYKKIISLYPEDIESYLLLGDLYLANEDYLSSEQLYRKALSLEPENQVIQRRVSLSSYELTNRPGLEIPTDVESVSKLLQDIIGRPESVTEEDLNKAASLLTDIVHSSNPAEIVANNLEKIDDLLPALIELNIRQARNDRRYDLVNMLQALLEEISTLRTEPSELQHNHVERYGQSSKFTFNNVLFLLNDETNISERITIFSEALNNRNCKIYFQGPASKILDENIDFVVAFNPHINPTLMEQLAIYSSRHIPIILDLDDDFEYMPIHHPQYTLSGLGSLEKSRSYAAALLFANVITVPGYEMAKHIKDLGYTVKVIPFGWSKKNDQWLKNPPSRSTVNIGLVGLPGNFEDVQKYRRIIVRIMREYSQTRLVVCGDPVTYKLFESIAENRRVFLPKVPDEEMPYILNQIDILAVPINSTPYQMVSTDRLLMQAGVKGIPWIASPIPDFMRWQAGGVTAEKPEEWHSYLRQFIQDKDLRITLGQAGKKNAESRESSNIRDLWNNVIDHLLTEQSPPKNNIRRIY